MILRFPRLLAALTIALLVSGCGDTFRPTAIPIPVGNSPDPANTRYAIVVSNNNGGVGAVTQINVPGDTTTAVLPTSGGSVHATLSPNQSQTYIANQSGDSVTAYVTFGPHTFPTVTISLPAGSAPSFVIAPSATRAFAANTGRNTVGIIDAGQNVLITEVAVGTSPVAIAANANGTKVYVANRGSNSVTVIDTATNVVVTTIPVGTSPSWAVNSTDGNLVFVANEGSNTVTVIETATDTVIATIATGAGPRYLAYERNSRRVYSANTAGNSVTVIKADVNPPTALATISMGATGTAPTSVAPLPDGSRAYVTNSGSNTVAVVDAIGLRLSTTRPSITVGTAPVHAGAAGDSSKVYVANSTANTISIIRTSDDTVIGTVNAGAQRPVYVVTTQ